MLLEFKILDSKLWAISSYEAKFKKAIERRGCMLFLEKRCSLSTEKQIVLGMVWNSYVLEHVSKIQVYGKTQ